MAQGEGLLLGLVLALFGWVQGLVPALAVVGPLGQTPDGRLPGWNHRTRLVVVRLLPEEWVGLHVKGQVTVVTWESAEETNSKELGRVCVCETERGKIRER